MDGRSEDVVLKHLSLMFFLPYPKPWINITSQSFRTLISHSFSVYHHDENSVLYAVHDKLGRYNSREKDHELNALDTNFKKS